MTSTMDEPAEAIVPLGVPVFRQPERSNGVGALLIHGFSGSPHQMRDLGDLLVRHGYTVSIPRLPGHASTLAYFAKAQADDWRLCIEEAFQTLREHGLSVMVIGRSFGGVLALDLALQHPRDVLGCICIGTPAPLAANVWLRRLLPVVRLFRKNVNKPWAKPEERERRIAQGRYLTLPLAAVQQFLDVLVTMTPLRLQELRLPMVFIQGSTDTAVAPASLAYYRKHCAGDHADFLWLDTVGHDAGQLHGHPQVQEKVLKFLEDCRKTMR